MAAKSYEFFSCSIWRSSVLTLTIVLLVLYWLLPGTSSIGIVAYFTSLTGFGIYFFNLCLDSSYLSKWDKLRTEACRTLFKGSLKFCFCRDYIDSAFWPFFFESGFWFKIKFYLLWSGGSAETLLLVTPPGLGLENALLFKKRSSLRALKCCASICCLVMPGAYFVCGLTGCFKWSILFYNSSTFVWSTTGLWTILQNLS